MNKKSKITFFALIMVVILVVSSVFVYIEYYKEEKPALIQEEIKVIDDRINPYIYQGLTVEILRMRNRGIIDKMFTFGTSWNHPPVYYYIVEVDGEVGDTSEIEAAGGVTGSGTFNVWDTLGKECRTNFWTPDGQKTSQVTITIMETKKTGLLSRQETQEEKLSIGLTFDYRTGHWTDDDYLKDNDGYGHVLGDEYELWFNIYESDYDHDWIPYWTEVNVYSTDPTVADGFDDPDSDGIPSWWEWKYGYDPSIWDNHEKLDPDIDGVENTEEYMMVEYFADPFYPDVYIEVDFMEHNPNTLFDTEHLIYKESQQMVIEKMSGYGISVYFDDGWPDGPVNGGGEYLEFVETIDEIVGGHMARWYKHNFADERKGAFRYFQMVNNAGLTTASEYNTYDHILMDNSPLKTYTKRYAFTPRRQRVVMAQGALHELGHTMGIVPASFVGVDNIPGGNVHWPEILTEEEWQQVNVEYKSIMNYNYMFRVLTDRNYFDFSDGTHGEYDFNDLIHFYLPTFQMDAAILESPKISSGNFEEFSWTDKDPDPVYDGWEYAENLTTQFTPRLSKLRFDLDNAVEYDYRIYVKTDNTQEGRGIRIYTKPNIKPMPALWSLIAETEYLNATGEPLEFYSFDPIYQELLEML